MFRLATCMLEGRKVLLVEDDEYTADIVSASIENAGGTIVGYSDTVKEAIGMVVTSGAELLMLHVRYVRDVAVPIRDICLPLGIEVEFMACYDDWYEFADDGADDGLRILLEG